MVKGKLDFSKIDMTKVKKRLLQLGLSSLTVASLTGCSIKKDDDFLNNSQVTIETTVSNINEDDINELKNEVEEVKEDEKPIIIIEDHDDNEKAFIPNFVLLDFEDGYKSEGYTYKDLKHVIGISMSIMDTADLKEEDFDFLNYTTNAKSIHIAYRYDNDIKLRNVVDFSRYSNMEKVTIDGYATSLFANKIAFLKDFKYIDELNIGASEGIYIDEVNADKLIINSINKYNDISYKDLTRFNKIDIEIDPYDAAVNFTSGMISDLRSKGIEVIIKDEEEFNKVNEKLNQSILEIDIKASDTEEEKIRKIVRYVINSTDYDPEISRLAKDKSYITEASKFYDKGALYPFYEEETTICGNYASITTALGKRAGLDIYSLSAPEHSFNLIKIGDYYYFLDVTFLEGTFSFVPKTTVEYDSDGKIKKETLEYVSTKSEELFQNDDVEKIWNLTDYLADPTKMLNDEGDVHHHPFSYPKDIEITEIPDDQEIKNVLLGMLVEEAAKTEQQEIVNDEVKESEEKIPDLTEKKFKFKINGKVVVVPAAVLVGILVGLGCAKRKQRIREDARRRRRSSSYDPFADDDYDISLDDEYVSSKRRRRR